MQDVKERVALSSIAASGGLTIGKAIVGLAVRLARDPVGSRAFADRSCRDRHDLFRGALFRQAGRRGAPLRPRQDRERHGAGRNGVAVPALRRGDLGGGPPPARRRRRTPSKRRSGPSRSSSSRSSSISSAPGCSTGSRPRLRARRSKPTRCISAPTCGRRLRCSSASAAMLLGYPWADAAAALVVAAFVCLAGWRLGSRTVRDLDRRGAAGRARADHRDRLARARGRRCRARARAARRRRRCSSTSRLPSAARCRSTAWTTSRPSVCRAPSKRDLPGAEVSVITTPRALDDETVIERVLVIARNRALAVHHVTVHAIGERLAVSLDLEVDGDLTLAAAHEIADELEHAIQRRARARRRGRDPYRAAADRGPRRPRRIARAGRGSPRHARGLCRASRPVARRA